MEMKRGNQNKMTITKQDIERIKRITTQASLYIYEEIERLKQVIAKENKKKKTNRDYKETNGYAYYMSIREDIEQIRKKFDL